jgi:uncharacterized delta-60 repeat protein
MKVKKCAFLVALSLAISTSVFGGGPPTQWAAHYNGTGNGSDLASNLAVDGSGNVYVTGFSYGGSTYDDYATVKYDPNGVQLWVKRYNGPGNGDDGASDIAIDLSGNVYVTGYSYGSGTETDYATIKYSADGTQLWLKRYNGSGNSDDSASALAVDGSGNVYVTGTSYGSITGTDYATIKYSADGNQLWAARYNGSENGDEEAYDLAIDSSGNVYVTGISVSEDTSSDYVTLKYGPNGNPLWVASYNGTGNSDDSVFAIVTDSSGNAYVTGTSFGGSTNYDFATVKYGPDGSQLWATRYNGPGNDDDGAQDLVVDSAGNVYVTGYGYDSNTNYDFVTVKYDPAGNQLWATRYNGPANGSDFAYALAIDNWGNVYVTGISFDGNTDNDYATVKYSPDGREIWVARYNGTANSSDYVSAVSVDNSGNVYVTGQSMGIDNNFDYATVKYIQKSYCTSPVAGDLNNDCKVDLEDFSLMASHWLECNYALQEDCR